MKGSSTDLVQLATIGMRFYSRRSSLWCLVADELLIALACCDRLLNRAAGPASQCAYQCLLIRCEPTERWAAVALLVGQRAASVEEFVFLHDVQAYRQTRCQNSRCKFGAPLSWVWLFERHRPAGGTATPAGVPSGECFDAPFRSSPNRWSVLEEP